jgi:ABC-type Fe3+-hydroxamate transport system substrate-binding protein
MGTFLDDLGHPVSLGGPPARIVSLVPSLTEALAATCPDRLVGATDWCVQPRDLSVGRVRGTKNPDHAAIAALAPDLVVANQEENRAVDVDRLRAAGVAVWVTVVESVADALHSMRRLIVEALGAPVPGWLDAAESAWSEPAPATTATAVVPVWRDPWMVVGPSTYAGDLLERLGVANLFAGDQTGSRYPRVSLADLRAWGPDVVILPDEPYAFSPEDGPEAFPGIPTALVMGRDLTWYGPAMVTAAERLRPAIDRALGH